MEELVIRAIAFPYSCVIKVGQTVNAKIDCVSHIVKVTTTTGFFYIPFGQISFEV